MGKERECGKGMSSLLGADAVILCHYSGILINMCMFTETEDCCLVPSGLK